MAKSKVGGTRAFIRGRIGSDVYSVGKTSKGARQQVVRSLAEQVSNPRTQEQMKGRMIMSTVMQAVSALQPIIDHSFDGLPVGQPSISEFIRQNYALVKADIAAHPSSGNKFGINMYQQKGALAGSYVISAGKVEKPEALFFDDSVVMITLTANTLTVGGLKNALGISADGFFTVVIIGSESGAVFERFHVKPALEDSTAITSENVGTLFVTEGTVQLTPVLETNTISITPALSNDDQSLAVILSDKENGAWKHSSAAMKCSSSPANKANAALPTYPTGTAQFLNGGDL